MLNFSKQFFIEQYLGRNSFSFRHLWHFTNILSTVTLRQLLRRSPSKTIIIWLTKQIKIPKTVETFFRRFPRWSLAVINSWVTFLKQGIFRQKIHFFVGRSSLQSTRNCFLLIWSAFLVFDRKPFLCSVSEPPTMRNSEKQLSGNPLLLPPLKKKNKNKNLKKKMRRKFPF